MAICQRFPAERISIRAELAQSAVQLTIGVPTPVPSTR
jgi:hypothetical protein